MPMDMKAVIADNLRELLKHKKLDKITVKELVEMCNISRQTFYYHFQDIMDVIVWHQNQVLKQSIEKNLSAPTYQDAIRGIVQEIFQSRDLIEQLLSSQRREDVERLFLQAVRSYLQEILRMKAPSATVSAGDIETILCFYSCGLVGTVLANLNRKNLDVDTLSDQICRLLTGDLGIRFNDSHPH